MRSPITKKVTFRLFLLAGFLSLVGCGGPHYYKPALGPDQPAEITISAYTQQGCLNKLQKEASDRNVEIKLKDVQEDVGWAILWFPLYRGYKCTGVVVEPK
jgi:hypothetical protein